MFPEVPGDIKVVGCFFEGSFFESFEIKEKVAKKTEKSVQKIKLKFSKNRKNEKRRKTILNIKVIMTMIKIAARKVMGNRVLTNRRRT